MSTRALGGGSGIAAQLSTTVLINSVTPTVIASELGLNGSSTSYAALWPFTVSVATSPLIAAFKLRVSGSPSTGNMTAQIYADTAGSPTGSALATSDPVSSAVLTSDPAVITFLFSALTSLPPGDYWLVIDVAGVTNTVRAQLHDEGSHSIWTSADAATWTGPTSIPTPYVQLTGTP